MDAVDKIIDTRVTLKELVGRFAAACGVSDLEAQLVEAIPDLKIDKQVANCPNLIIEQLVSRIIDLVVASRITSKTMPYYLVGLCTTHQKDQRKELENKVETEQKCIEKLE